MILIATINMDIGFKWLVSLKKVCLNHREIKLGGWMSNL